MKIGFIGTGTIAEAIVTGLDRAGYAYDEIVVSERSAAISRRLSETCARVLVSPDNQEIVDRSDMLFLTVRPQVAEQILSGFRYRPAQLVVSAVATLRHDTLSTWTGPDVTVVRAMPLPFVATCEGPTPIFPANATVEDLFAFLGRPVVCRSFAEFETISVVSMTMGLYFGIEETLAAWLAERGIEPGNARAMIDAIYLNLARTGMAEKGRSLSDLRAAHSTRGGLNEQVWHEFAAHGGIDAFRAALNSAYGRVMPQPSPERDG
ncbi:MAG: NAD(P)-binding domain-containing protein [Alphaproteobacteria bacterium]|nr:NAD(P)-binding domain-containing protein [Alphaproteobacteria bacterium]